MFRVLFLLLVVNLFSVFPLESQSPYTLNTGKELALSGTGFGLFGTSLLIDRRVEPLMPEEIALLDPISVWGVDRWVTRQWSVPAQKVSDVGLFTSIALPIALLAGEESRSDFGKVGLFTIESFLLNYGLTGLTKVLAKRPRPYLFNSGVPMNYKLNKDSRYSFFSGHTSTSACLSFLSAKMFSDYYPESDARPVVWAVAVALPAFTGWHRIRGGKHYLTDVLAGYAVGAAVGLLVPELHKD